MVHVSNIHVLVAANYLDDGARSMFGIGDAPGVCIPKGDRILSAYLRKSDFGVLGAGRCSGVEGTLPSPILTFFGDSGATLPELGDCLHSILRNEMTYLLKVGVTTVFWIGNSYLICSLLIKYVTSKCVEYMPILAKDTLSLSNQEQLPEMNDLGVKVMFLFPCR